MAENPPEESATRHYCKRFGMIAVDKGFVSPEDLKKVINIQLQEDLAGEKHRVIGCILFSLDLMTADQIDEVLNGLFDERRSAFGP